MNKDIGKLSAIGNKARLDKLTPEQRKASASIAAKARWDRYWKQPCYQCHAYRSAHKRPLINHDFKEQP